MATGIKERVCDVKWQQRNTRSFSLWPRGSQRCFKCHLYLPLFIPQLALICQAEMGQSIQRSLLKSSRRDDLSVDLISFWNDCS